MNAEVHTNTNVQRCRDDGSGAPATSRTTRRVATGDVPSTGSAVSEEAMTAPHRVAGEKGLDITDAS
jgi:hypothetical protein